MGRRSRNHRERVSAGLDPPIRQPKTSYLALKCGKCGTTITEAGVTGHLKECQPAGAKCGRCHETFKPDVFLDHFKGCTGPKKTILSEPPPGPLGGAVALVSSDGHIEVIKEPDAENAI